MACSNCHKLRDIPGTGESVSIGQTEATVTPRTENCAFDFVVHSTPNTNLRPVLRVRFVNAYGEVCYETSGAGIYTVLNNGVIENRIKLDTRGTLPSDGHYNVVVDVDGARQPVFKVLRDCDTSRGVRCC